ncbi:DNase I-like protein [Stereum hirsutum FP-91666 SS1]|uniref:DNase I-like protein n=1 Tax=Stereum hirsutum (strain FP-91666) TaxID=721885 RepID=UPI0004449884|nr:DNase I-like protein [Stereum hirsutum FP-91666 SS1]EIM81597.1 DNase I-like protein [Stereum hirsutum FP-91666 SS1]
MPHPNRAQYTIIQSAPPKDDPFAGAGQQWDSDVDLRTHKSMRTSQWSQVGRVRRVLLVLPLLGLLVLLFGPWRTGTPIYPHISQIQGLAFQSPLRNQALKDIRGIVTAKGSTSFWLTDPELSPDPRYSSGVKIYTKSTRVLNSISVGDHISLAARVTEYRSYRSLNDLLGTQLTAPSSINVYSKNNTITPIILGRDRSPPTQALSALDTGADGWLSVPGNDTLLEKVNGTLKPEDYGLDFWESLEGALVTIPGPVALDFNDRFGSFWVRGAWNVTGLNERGGLTVTIGPDGIPDANPEAIMIGKPLDRSKNPVVALGTQLADITGVVEYAFGMFYVMPITTPVIIEHPDFEVPPSALAVDPEDTCTLLMGDYNIENMAPTSSHLPLVASHIVNHLNTPDLMFLQEVQDNSGRRNDGTVSANVTLSTLADAIFDEASKQAVSPDDVVKYRWLDIDPEDGMDGGIPGGNIRVAYLYNSNKFNLVTGAPAGGAWNATRPYLDSNGQVALTLNPGRIDPENDAWDEARKPLVTHWETPSGDRFFTINHHGSSKRGSTSIHGDARPPVNAGADKRRGQVASVANFIESVLALDPNASIILAGDFNDFPQTRSVFAPLTTLTLPSTSAASESSSASTISAMIEADVAASIPPTERYTYMFDQNCEQLDHIFVSNAVASREGGVDLVHVHVNNWAESVRVRASDHDPSVVKVRVC